MRMAESNLPPFLDDSDIGDAYLTQFYNKPPDWRWRLPELERLKQENTMILNESQMAFECDPTLDSFAAFAEEISIAPAATGNNAINVLSGLLRDITPAAQQRISQAIAPGGRTSFGGVLPNFFAPTAGAVPSSSKTPLIIGGVVAAAILAFVLLKKK